MAPELSTSAQFTPSNLAHNDKKIRYAATRNVETYLRENTDALTDLDLLKLWKGLFYCTYSNGAACFPPGQWQKILRVGMWMSDKRPVQQDLSRRLAQFMHAFTDPVVALAYAKSFWFTMVREWNGLDVLRLDKYYFLMRVMMGETFVLMEKCGWAPNVLQAWPQVLQATVLNCEELRMHRIPKALSNHVLETTVAIFMDFVEERPEREEILMAALVLPFEKLLRSASDKRVVQQCIESVHLCLLDEYQLESVAEHLKELHADTSVSHFSRHCVQRELVKRGKMEPPAAETHHPVHLPLNVKRERSGDSAETIIPDTVVSPPVVTKKAKRDKQSHQVVICPSEMDDVTTEEVRPSESGEEHSRGEAIPTEVVAGEEPSGCGCCCAPAPPVVPRVFRNPLAMILKTPSPATCSTAAFTSDNDAAVLDQPTPNRVATTKTSTKTSTTAKAPRQSQQTHLEDSSKRVHFGENQVKTFYKRRPILSQFEVIQKAMQQSKNKKQPQTAETNTPPPRKSALKPSPSVSPERQSSPRIECTIVDGNDAREYVEELSMSSSDDGGKQVKRKQQQQQRKNNNAKNKKQLKGQSKMNRRPVAADFM